MAEIKVTTRELTNKADTLERLNRSFRDAVRTLEGLEKQLAGMWEGDAQRAFRNAFNGDKIKMDQFALNIDKYITALRQDAIEYDKAENHNTQVATNRK